MPFSLDNEILLKDQNTLKKIELRILKCKSDSFKMFQNKICSKKNAFLQGLGLEIASGISNLNGRLLR